MARSRLRANQARVLRSRSCCLARKPGITRTPVASSVSKSPRHRREGPLFSLWKTKSSYGWQSRKCCASRGLEVFEAASGSAAIDLLRAKGGEIDLILLDLTIPGASSQEVLAEAALAQPNVKVILTSAYGEEVAKPMMNQPLVCGFIRKPFKLADLVQTYEVFCAPDRLWRDPRISEVVCAGRSRLALPHGQIKRPRRGTSLCRHRWI